MSERHVWRFAEAGRRLAAAAIVMELRVPAFRTPPRVAGVDRTIRRGAEGSALVSVRSRGRSWPAVVADMIEGVVHANRLDPSDAARVRNELWRATEGIDTAEANAPEAEGLPLPEPTDVPRAA